MYCDVSLPVPLNQAFTYLLPETLRHRVQTGCRVLAPFGARKLTGVVLRVHHTAPQGGAREILKLIDEEPVLDAGLLKLGAWIADYYCAPLGEVLRSMTPLAGEVRHSKVYSLTDSGRDSARQLFLSDAEDDPALLILKLLDSRPSSASYLIRKLPTAARVLKNPEKKGLVNVADLDSERDPLRDSAARLRVEFLKRPDDAKLP